MGRPHADGLGLTGAVVASVYLTLMRKFSGDTVVHDGVFIDGTSEVVDGSLGNFEDFHRPLPLVLSLAVPRVFC